MRRAEKSPPETIPCDIKVGQGRNLHSPIATAQEDGLVARE